MKFNHILKNKLFLFLFLAVTFLIASSLSNHIVRKRDGSFLISGMVKILHNKEREANHIISDILKKNKNDFNLTNFKPEFYNNLYKEKGILMLFYENDSLKYWSGNDIPFESYNCEFLKKSNFLFIGNAWFEVIKTGENNKTAFGLILIKHEYPYHNEYLANNFNKDFDVPYDAEVATEKGENNIYSYDGRFLFSMQFNDSSNLVTGRIFIPVLLLIAGIIFAIIFLFRFNKMFGLSEAKAMGLLIIELLLLRFITFYSDFPKTLYDLQIFRPFYYASSSFLPSLGDLFINSSLLLFISILIYKHFNIISLKDRFNKVYRNIFAFIAFIFIFILFSGLVYFFRSLIIDSDISLTLNDLFSLSKQSIIAFFILTSLIFSFLFLSLKLCETAYLSVNTRNYLILSVITSVIFWCFTFINILYLIIPILFILLYIYFRHRAGNFQNIISFPYVVCLLLVFSLFSTYFLHKNNNAKEQEQRKLLAATLFSERDPLAEYLFQDIIEKSYSDNVLKKYLSNNPIDEEQVCEYFSTKYFSGYWKKYNIQITVCRPADSLIVAPENISVGCKDYFDNKISYTGKKTACKDLYYVDDGTGRNSYISCLTFQTDSLHTKTTLYIELLSKFIPKDLGYPKLLVDKGSDRDYDFTNYSYAKYINGRLTSQFGNCFYSTNSGFYGSSREGFHFFNIDDYSHLIYKPDASSTIIISRKEQEIIDIISPFSYLFAFFGICFFIIYLIIGFSYDSGFFEFNFKNRLQISITSIIIISFLFVGVSSLLYIIHVNKNKNINVLSEKTHSILIELEHKLSNNDNIYPEMHNYISSLLIKFSNVFFSDINLYDLHGDLIASSRPEIFNEGLISRKMNMVAYDNMHVKNKTLFIHNENIGNLEYYSAYIPLGNNRDEIVAYINLPYFAKQNELRQEISSFIIAFINIYVLLIVFAIFIALFVSGYISKPLSIIKEKIGNITLGKKNEKIEWTRKDEIGTLVEEYNRMIDELAESVEMLARSERESAWREMAKQVAHEIKNPLTPMKLSIQHLQKSWEDKSPDWPQKLEKISRTIIEQIDSLSRIATEFSDFAKMPQSRWEKLEISEVISTAVELYKDIRNIDISFSNKGEKYFINADREQILRVFNNLLNNSVQAIDNSRKGMINISVDTENDNYVISISDNGTGIADEQIDRIFSPNFTTKTGGMGLGLAIVKSIVESSGGKIRFTTRINEGTTFYITLPKL